MRAIFTWFRNLLFGSSTSSALRSENSTGSARTTRKRCFEILLPLTSNDGRPVDPEMFQLTRDELAARFGGVSFSSQTIRGLWIHRGTKYEDESRRLFVDADDTP